MVVQAQRPKNIAQKQLIHDARAPETAPVGHNSEPPARPGVPRYSLAQSRKQGKSCFPARPASRFLRSVKQHRMTPLTGCF
jgi:hypothetical protein